MTIISEIEFKNNVSKYLDLAQNERIIIKRGKKHLELGTKKPLITDEDIANSMTGEELKKALEPQIREMFR